MRQKGGVVVAKRQNDLFDTDADGLPIGLQITSPHLSEAQLFHVARAFEQAQGLIV